MTWVADDGTRCMRSEVVLLHKARWARPKDDADLAVAWPLLGEAERTWLRDEEARLYPGHAWLAAMG